MFALDIAKVESVFIIKAISEYVCPCSVNILVHSATTLLSISEFRYL